MVHKDMNNMAIAEYFQKDIHLHLFLLLIFTNIYCKDFSTG